MYAPFVVAGSSTVSTGVSTTGGTVLELGVSTIVDSGSASLSATSLDASGSSRRYFFAALDTGTGYSFVDHHLFSALGYGSILILVIIIAGCKRNNQNSQKEKQQYF